MKQTLLVAGQELWVNLRRPGFIIMTLLIPALGFAVLLLASAFGSDVGGFVESQFAPERRGDRLRGPRRRCERRAAPICRCVHRLPGRGIGPGSAAVGGG